MERTMPVAFTARSRLSTSGGYQPLKSSQAARIEQICVPAMEYVTRKSNVWQIPAQDFTLNW
jgi:hypothetical protein